MISGISAAGTSAASAETKAAAIVVDANTGKTLYSSNPDAQRFPASLTKMMTLYMLFDAMAAGKVSKSTPIPVSAYAAGQPPTKVGFRPGQTISAEAAILSLITKSANDSATAIGEYLGGSEQRFAVMMTNKARQLGMRNTQFRNANGLPDPQQRSSARDLALLGIALREHFPQYYDYFSTRSFTYNGRRIVGHNRLLGKVRGVDGIKTGYTRASGFNLVSSVNVDGKKLVAVVMGGTSGGARDAQMAQLIDKYLPSASRRDGGNLIASRRNSKVEVAAVDLPDTAPVPVPARREEVATTQSAEVITAYADPKPVPSVAARVLQVPAPQPKAEIGEGDVSEVDPVTTASAPSAGGWMVQIASVGSSEEAKAMLAKAAAQVGGPIASLSPYTEKFQKGAQTYHRARFAGITNAKAANNACAALKRQNFNCFAIAPQS
ncbi:D-alanyl-D-alanine carboxypeptidase [Phyllobacterium sp. SYP-B3895]|uniref:D-alanyl-D-alanine carboxypeptidase family protein n=1 Tax=Phyllobacterium sp. SYP-B3895 TaxID=2663240 RepID=UPI001299EA53|nr:D-alanyl-D-alanine carboxypeptidase family protein [Phyllobacterium sp. SYP-B3895]MRG55487.1 D-alanyl-D-alanine carboxypeptidase [Phyllobacterium sp. SYP-B3895]